MWSYTIPKGCATGGHSRDEAGCEGDFWRDRAVRR
jgi:hypothetical protein